MLPEPLFTCTFSITFIPQTYKNFMSIYDDRFISLTEKFNVFEDPYLKFWIGIICKSPHISTVIQRLDIRTAECSPRLDNWELVINFNHRGMKSVIQFK